MFMHAWCYLWNWVASLGSTEELKLLLWEGIVSVLGKHKFHQPWSLYLDFIHLVKLDFQHFLTTTLSISR